MKRSELLSLYKESRTLPYLEYTTEGSLCLEKLYRIYLEKSGLIQPCSEYDLYPEDGYTMSGAFDDEFFERYLFDESSSLYSKLLSCFRTLGLGYSEADFSPCNSDYEIISSECFGDDEEKERRIQLLIERSSPEELVKNTFYCPNPEAIMTIAPFLKDFVVESLQDEEYMESLIETRWVYMESPIIGAFLESNLARLSAKSSLIEETEKLIEKLGEPFCGSQAAAYSGLFKGVWYAMAFYGVIDSYSQVYLTSLDAEWYPAACLLSKNLKVLNRRYKFYRKEEKDAGQHLQIAA